MKLLVALFLALHAQAGPVDRARYEAVARGIAEAAEAHPLKAGKAASERLLGAIAEHEGGLRESVRRCAVTGDSGRAVTLFQIHPEALGAHSRAEACASDELAARLALASLRAGEKMCGGSLRCAVRLYASGTRRNTKAAREIYSLFLRLRAR